jgi:uncharacterized membrane protein (DUF4010 family)
MAYAKRCREEGFSAATGALVILIAWTLVYLRLILEVITVAPSFRLIILPLFILFGVSALATLWVWRRAPRDSGGMPPQTNPTELKTAISFAVLYAIILLAVAAAEEQLGRYGLGLVAFISGMTDMDAVTLSAARLVETGSLEDTEAWPVIIIACMSNLVFKTVIAGVAGGKRLLQPIILPLCASLATGLGLILFW